MQIYRDDCAHTESVPCQKTTAARLGFPLLPLLFNTLYALLQWHNISTPTNHSCLFCMHHALYSPFIFMFGISVDDVQNCIGYDCQQKPDEIVCSVVFPEQWTLTEFKNVTFTFLDCNVQRQSQIQCSLEMEGCNNVGNDTVSVEANHSVNGSFPSTCSTHTYCIIAHVAMERQKSVYLNSTARKLPETA